MGEGGGGTSNNVYIRSEEYAWIPARLVEQDKTSAKVAIPQYANEESIMSDGGKAAIGFKSAIVKLADYQNHSLPLQNVGKDGALKELDDMVDLPYLHEVRVSFSKLDSLSLCFRLQNPCIPAFGSAGGVLMMSYWFSYCSNMETFCWFPFSHPSTIYAINIIISTVYRLPSCTT